MDAFLEPELNILEGFDWAKNGAPLKNSVNTTKIEGRAPPKTMKKSPNNEEKTVLKRRRNGNAFLIDFGSNSGAFQAILGARNRRKIV